MQLERAQHSPYASDIMKQQLLSTTLHNQESL